jgi:hypothetical protein
VKLGCFKSELSRFDPELCVGIFGFIPDVELRRGCVFLTHSKLKSRQRRFTVADLISDLSAFYDNLDTFVSVENSGPSTLTSEPICRIGDTSEGRMVLIDCFDSQGNLLKLKERMNELNRRLIVLSFEEV